MKYRFLDNLSLSFLLLLPFFSHLQEYSLQFFGIISQWPVRFRVVEYGYILMAYWMQVAAPVFLLSILVTELGDPLCILMTRRWFLQQKSMIIKVRILPQPLLKFSHPLTTDNDFFFIVGFECEFETGIAVHNNIFQCSMGNDILAAYTVKLWWFQFFF